MTAVHIQRTISRYKLPHVGQSVARVVEDINTYMIFHIDSTDQLQQYDSCPQPENHIWYKLPQVGQSVARVVEDINTYMIFHIDSTDQFQQYDSCPQPENHIKIQVA